MKLKKIIVEFLELFKLIMLVMKQLYMVIYIMECKCPKSKWTCGNFEKWYKCQKWPINNIWN